MIVGIASHITAAAAGIGARRYDPALTPEQRSGIDNGIWLCRSCDGIVDRDAARYPEDTLKRIRREHTEFARLGAHVEAEIGLIVVGPEIVAAGQVVKFNAFGAVVRIAFFLRGSAEDLFTFVYRFDSHSLLSRYVLLSESGLDGLLSDVPEVSRDGAAWTISFKWQQEAPRMPAAELSGISGMTGKAISGNEYWKQTFANVLEQPPGTWFADMAGGSHLSELYETLRESVWFEHLVKCELARLACIPAPPRRGRQESKYPPLAIVRQVLGVQIPDTTLTNDRLSVKVDFDLEGHGRWSGELSLFIYNGGALRKERSKAAWINEGIRRAENGERMLPSHVPPESWDSADGFPA